MKVLSLLVCLLVAVHASTYKGQRTTLEDIERDLSGNDKSTTYPQIKKVPTPPLSTPTKFGFIPHRTASSYAASKPKLQYTQSNYQVKQSSPKLYQDLSYQKPQQQAISTLPYATADQSQQNSQNSQQYIPQQQAQEYSYIQPDTPQQYEQYYQPAQQYEQYHNVQYLTDNSINQQDGNQQYYLQQPQYYYVQQYQAPSTAVETAVDSKTSQFVSFIPSYASNSIPRDQQYQEQQFTNAEQQLPPIKSTVAKYTTVVTKRPKYASQQYYSTPQKIQYYPQEEIIIKREPKSLLDSYVPSVLQLQYLKHNQGKGSISYSKY